MKKALITPILLSSTLFAQPSEEIKQIKEELEVVKEELRKLKLEISMPQISTYESYSGLGPAASKALINPKGVSIGGYGELHFIHNSETKPENKMDLKRVILYFGYSFSEKLKFNSEIEIEHAFVEGGEKSGELATEFAFLDYRLSRAFGVRGGMILVPVGIINEFHEPPTFYSVDRPYLERNIIPTTWRENGFGFYGETDWVSYRAYVLNGMKVKKGEFKSNAPLKKLRQNGGQAAMDEIAFTARIDFKLPMNTLIGASAFISGVQNENGDRLGSISLFSPHLWWQYAGFDIRFVGAYATVSDADKISQGLDDGVGDPEVFPKKIQGFYLQVAYNVFRFTDLEQELYVFGMYEDYDTYAGIPSGYAKPAGHKVRIYNFGFSYKPHPLVALKADYVKEDYSNGKNDQDLYRAALSWMF